MSDLDQNATHEEEETNPLYGVLWLANRVSIVVFVATSYYLLLRWNVKSTRLYMFTLSEEMALVFQIASFIYLIGFFGIEYIERIDRAT